MSKIRWSGLAVLMAMCMVTASANAQDVPLSAFGPPPVPDAEFCPPGPGVETMFPFTSPPLFLNGFREPCEECPTPMFYVGIGTIALSRGAFGEEVVAVIDPQTVDTGNLPPANAPVAARYNVVDEEFHFGVKGTIGWQLGADSIEFSGYYIPAQVATGDVVMPGRLDLPFANFPPPLGFEGTNFLWLQADRVEVRYEDEIYNLEVNYKTSWLSWLAILGGFRYFDLNETFSIFTDDDGVVVQPPDPLRMATVSSRVHHRLAGAQFGFQTRHYMTPPFSVGLTNKNFVAANFYEVDNFLVRGDGFQGPSASRDDIQLSGIIELEAYFQWQINYHMGLLLSYQTMWLLNVPEAQNQISFDPGNPGAVQDNNGNIFYHGPRLEFFVGW